MFDAPVQCEEQERTQRVAAIQRTERSRFTPLRAAFNLASFGLAVAILNTETGELSSCENASAIRRSRLSKPYDICPPLRLLGQPT